MNNGWQMNYIKQHLHELCDNIGARSTGSANNQRAASYVGNIFQQQGCQVEYQQFDCSDWKRGEIVLLLDGQPVKAAISDYSAACDVAAPYQLLGSLTELEQANVDGKIAVLHGELTKETLMPKNFTFYNPEEHQKIIGVLEAKQPLAIVTVSFSEDRPIPIIEDGDVLIPCAVVAKQDSTPFFRQTDAIISLKMDIQRVPSRGANVIARIPGTGVNGNGRIIVMSHLDTKPHTPGAIDNATGMVIQMLLSKLMQNSKPKQDIELVVFNGEDTFGIPGEMAYLQKYGDFSGISFVINNDGVGYKDGKTGVAYMGCSEALIAACEPVRARYASLQPMEPWYQSDHSIFFQQGVAAIALTTPLIGTLTDTIIHTEHDTPEIVAPEYLSETAEFLYRIITGVDV